nr:molybdopterin cofactor-binding domain-containing protein [Thetidibacter halocola]
MILRTGKVDLGQRISTALVRIATEELSVPPDRIAIAPVRTGDSPDEGITSGSNSIEQSGLAQRLACATARIAALALAADRLGTTPDALDLDDGRVTHRGTNRSLDMVDLVAALPEDLPVDRDAPARVLPEPLPEFEPRGLRAMVEGRYTYVHDLDRPGMLHARVLRPPMMDARLADLPQDIVAGLESAGLHLIRDGSFVAVAGPQEWPVVRAAERLSNGCRWDIGDGLETGDIFQILAAREAQRFPVIDGTPKKAPLPDPLASADFDARFERPYTMHGALAPSAALAEWRDGRLEILTHSQGLYFLRGSIADSLDMAEADIVLEHVPGSGCYGHNGADDVAFEAALIARAIPDTPILLKWSRADEHGREPLGTAMAVSVQAQVDGKGGLAALWMETRGDTHRGRPRKGANRAGPARLSANSLRDTDVPRFVPEPNMNNHAGLHRNFDPIYTVPDKRLVKALVADLPLRPSALRCLGAPANVLAIESMMDELAAQAGEDPIAYRRRHLDDPRAVAVLDALEVMLRDRPMPGEGGGRGIAYAQYKNAMTRVGLAVDLEIAETGEARLTDVILVADAGRIVDPDGLRAQLEGGVIQGASWALHERVLWGPEGRETLDWDSYPVLRFDNVPRIAVHLLDHPGAPSVGAGEASPGPTVAAIANAIHAATGLRLRRMPFDADAVVAAALQA